MDKVVEKGELRDWFRSGGSTEAGIYLSELTKEVMPGLDIRSTRTNACVTVFSPPDRPIMRRLSDRVAVATAGCGRGAKCSDELGRLGAESVC